MPFRGWLDDYYDTIYKPAIEGGSASRSFCEFPEMARRERHAAVIRAAARWGGITIGAFEQRQLRAIREELNHAHAARLAPAVAPKQTVPLRTLRADR
jgi:hypothetical protein